MAKKIAGTWNGTGADCYLCLGFVPHWFRAWNAEGTQRIMVEWNINMARTGEIAAGIILTAADQTAAALARTAGIEIYEGGVELTSTQAGTTTYGEGVYLKKDDTDRRASGSGVAINKWTLGSSTNYTGNWNAVCSTTYVGEGSTIVIDGKLYTVQAVSSNGEAANEVTLNAPAASGIIGALTGMYDYAPMVEGDVTLEGLKIDNATLNVNGQYCLFEAGTYDNF